MEVDLLPWKFSWKLVEVDLLPWNLMEAFMEIDGIFHGRWKRKLPLFPSIAASTNTLCGSFHELPYTPTYHHLFPRVLQTSICFHKTFIKVHRLPFDLLPWKLVGTSMETTILVNLLTCKPIYLHGSQFTYMEVDGSIFNSMEISTEVGGSRFTSMEVSGIFHGKTWKFPLSVEVEASIASINCSFHENIPWKLP